MKSTAVAKRILMVAVMAVPVAAGLSRGPAAVAQSAVSGDMVECRWTESPITIDGKMDDAAWQGAVKADRFRVPPQGGTPAKPATEGGSVRFLWDRENLYFLAELQDRDQIARIQERDGKTWLDDAFELFLKPAVDRPGYYEFHVTASGTELDLFFPRREPNGYEKYRSDGKFDLQTRVSRRGSLNKSSDQDEVWVVEGRLGWHSLQRTGGRPAPGETWKMAVCRYNYTGSGEPELSSIAPLAAANFHKYEEYGSLRFSSRSAETPAAPDVERVPLTVKIEGTPEPPPPYRSVRRYPRLKLNNPIMMAREPGARRILALIQEYPSGPTQLIRFEDRPEVERYDTLLKLDRVAYDLTFHPQFATNRYIYLGSKGPMNGGEKRMSVLRGVLPSPGAPPMRAEALITIIDWVSDGHDGGAMVFGKDGYLYLTTGDGTSDSDTHVVGQDMTRLTAKLLRLDVDHPAAGKNYSVPKDNPFVGKAEIRPETWAYGFRNPWRITMDEKTGAIWVGNNGQDLWETAYRVERGANYGWSVYEGSHPFYPNRKLGPTPLVKPTIEHPHSEFRSLTGGVVYYGKKFPELQGLYIYGDYSTGKVWGARHNGKRLTEHRELADTTLQITGFALDSDGEVLICDIRGAGEGGFHGLELTPKVVNPVRFPRRLSETGLFASVKDHRLQGALVPYDVNAALWSDGAHKYRYLALPGKDTTIEMTATRGWNFPDGSIIVKSFALDASLEPEERRRWIETRLLLKESGEWVGYSYRWNKDQTDAVLVGKQGEDVKYRVAVARSAENPSGFRMQTWHFPSRAECMVCHSRAANFVLGLSTVQMNRFYDYGSHQENQLRHLEKLGMLRTDWPAQARARLTAEAEREGLKGDALTAYVNRMADHGGQREPRSGGLLPRSPRVEPKLVDPYDPKPSLDSRARSYLHANCSHCHVTAGGGNAQIELEYGISDEATKLFGVKPVHHTFDLPDARLVKAGAPESSVLLRRVSKREKGFMPPLATALPDDRAVALLRQWIESKGSGGAR